MGMCESSLISRKEKEGYGEDGKQKAEGGTYAGDSAVDLCSVLAL